MKNIDIELLRDFRRQVQETGEGTLRDPRYPYEVAVEPSRLGHMITISDTSKPWWGRKVARHEHSLGAQLKTIDDGPVAMALMLLNMAIEKRLPF
ncbi:hypothetical protein [Rhizobium sp. Kim5]|uniref:hypothetical protein n=1 Tax=Rhizobium sp. Kim5 TaxID=2020311 RepID=UPI000A342BDE|nr:hypothetical protein [Rhizobium sp. Kim5]